MRELSMRKRKPQKRTNGPEVDFGPVDTKENLISKVNDIQRLSAQWNVGERLAFVLLSKTRAELTDIAASLDKGLDEETALALLDAHEMLEARAKLTETAFWRFLYAAKGLEKRTRPRLSSKHQRSRR
jgi:hypothetical protein